MCRGPIVDVGHHVGIEGLDNDACLWTCGKPVCRDAAITQLDRGYPMYRGTRQLPDGRIMLAPDVDHPLRGEIVVRVQTIQRVGIRLISAQISTEPEGRIVVP
jgi:hypothetical protein